MKVWCSNENRPINTLLPRNWRVFRGTFEKVDLEFSLLTEWFSARRKRWHLTNLIILASRNPLGKKLRVGRRVCANEGKTEVWIKLHFNFAAISPCYLCERANDTPNTHCEIYILNWMYFLQWQTSCLRHAEKASSSIRRREGFNHLFSKSIAERTDFTNYSVALFCPQTDDFFEWCQFSENRSIRVLF